MRYILLSRMVRWLDQVQWAFSGRFGESQADIATAVSTKYVAEQVSTK